MYTQCPVGQKRNQKLRVVMVLGDPSGPLPCSPPSSCLSSPSHPSWTRQSCRRCVQPSVPRAGRSFRPEVPNRTRASQRGPSMLQERERRHVSQPCPANTGIHLSGLFSFTPLPKDEKLLLVKLLGVPNWGHCPQKEAVSSGPMVSLEGPTDGQ